MKKLSYTDIQEQYLIDIRDQDAFHSGHLQHSLNLNPKNFVKYANDILSNDQDILFVADANTEEQVDDLRTKAEKLGFNQINGYLLIEEVPSEKLQTTDTISVQDFVNLDEDYTLLDLRHPDEISRPAPEDYLINIPLENLTRHYQTLDKSQTIYTLCGSGNRATTAASYLANKGFHPVVIEGGMLAVIEMRRKRASLK